MTTCLSSGTRRFMPGEDRLAELRELGAAMVDRRLVDRAQHAVRHVGRARDLQEVAAGRWRRAGTWTSRRCASASGTTVTAKAHARALHRQCARHRRSANPAPTMPGHEPMPIRGRSSFHPNGRQRPRGAPARRGRRATCCSIAASRGRYATDASIYQVEPVGVLVPRTTTTCARRSTICRELGVPVLPRGAGSSQCGQTVGAALVIDHSKHLTGVDRVRPRAR